MDVLNRKLFANKEARNKLAEMGGIMASSEALMREAQNVPMYAPGGVVDAPQRQPQFVITIPGYRNGAMLRINESTLMMMNDTIPDLMSQEGTQVFPVEMFGDSDAALKIRPGDAIINADLNPRQEQENPNPNLVNISDVPGDAGTIAGGYMAGMDQQMRDSLSQYPVPAVNRFDMELGTGYQGNTPAQLAAQQGEESRQRVEGYDRQFINDNANFPARNEPVVLGAGEANVPSIDRYDPTMAGLVSDLSGSGDFREPSRMTAMEQLIAEQSATPITLPSPVVSSAPEKLSVPNTMQDPRQVNQGTPTKFAQNITDYLRQEYKKAKDRNAGVSIAGYTADAPKPPVEGPQDSGTPLFAQEEFSADNLVPPSNTRPGPSTTDTDTGLSFGRDVPAMQNPGAWGEGIALTFGKTGNPGDATGVALSGLGVKPAEDLKSRNKQMQDLFKEMFGDSDEDVAKEKYLNLAMIGFAIASGASGNALTNISQGMMQGVSKMLEDQKDRKGRDEKLKYAAFNMASDAQIRADDRATALIDYESKRKDTFNDALTLYSLKKDRDDESKTFLDTEQGKGMSDTYDSLVTSFGSPGAALGELSKAYPPELIKRFQMATGLIAKPSSAPSLTANQQRLLDKANKKGN
jgi:hypothetical protein